MTDDQERNTANLLRKHFTYAVKVEIQQQYLANQKNQKANTDLDVKVSSIEVLHRMAVINLKIPKHSESSALEKDSNIAGLEDLDAKRSRQSKIIDREMNKSAQADIRKAHKDEEKKAEIHADTIRLHNKKLDKEDEILEDQQNKSILESDRKSSQHNSQKRTEK